MRLRRIQRIAGPLALVALLAAPVLPGAAGGVAQAHAQLVAGSPGPGAVLAEAPAEIRLVFSEPLETEVTSLDLAAADGTAILTRVGEIDPDDGFALVADVPRLADGVYTVRWRTLSAADGHVIEGSFSFGIGDPETIGALSGSDADARTASPAGIAARLLLYLGLMGAIGVAVFHLAVVRAGPAPRTLVVLLATLLGTASLASLALPAWEAVEGNDLGQMLLGTRNGVLALTRTAIAGLGAVAVLVVIPRHATRVAAATGVVGLGLHVAAGHAAGIDSPIGILGQVVHVSAAAVWLGGIASLLVATVAPRAIGGPTGLPPMRTLVPRFSALALGSIGLVVLSGVLAAWFLTGALLDLDTAYGRTLLVKGVLAVGALAIGGVNFLDGGRGRPWAFGLPIRLRGELGLAAGVLLATAMLSTTTPTDDIAGVAIEPVPDAFGRLAPDVSLELVPGRPGVNRLMVGTTDALASASLELAVELARIDEASSSRVPLSPTIGADAPEGLARWTADAQTLPAGSSWDASVLVVADDGDVLSRQRFSFTLDDDGVAEGRATSLLTPATIIAAIGLVSGALAIGLGLGGTRLPRCEATTSRIALLVGGAIAVGLGLGVGVDRLLSIIG